MIDPIFKHVVGANLNVDDTRLQTEEDYRLAVGNVFKVARANNADLTDLKPQLETLLKNWDRAELEEFMSETDRDWFFDAEGEKFLRVVIEEMIQILDRRSE